MARDSLVESAVGAAVLAAAGGFLVYALVVTGTARASGGYPVVARFGQAGGLDAGAEVRVAGVKVGTVSAVELDPKTYLALARLELDHSVTLPSDSSARITSDGLLGDSHILIEPGGAADNLRPGGEIINTQGAVDLFSTLGGMMRPPPSTPASAATPEN